MKIFLLFLFLLSSFYSNIFSQSGWIMQRINNAHNMKTVQFINPLTGWICEAQFADKNLSHIYKTTNNGINWTELYYSVDDIDGIWFINNTTGWMTTSYGILPPYSDIKKTTNGGTNWTTQLSIIEGFDRPLFKSDQFGCVQHGSLLYRTTNGGNYWMSDSINANPDTKIYFIDTLVGYYTYYGNIYKSINSGINWSLIYSNTNYQFFDIFFIDSLRGFSSGWSATPDSTGFIIKTTNGGINWYKIFSYNEILIELYFPNFNTGYVIGYPSRILKTTNAGSNWMQQICDSTYRFRDVWFVDALTGWIVGDSGLVMKSTNGGTFINFKANELPIKFILFQNYPNPFNQSTIFNYQCSIKSFVKLKLYDIAGKEIAILVNEFKQPGKYEIRFNGTNLASGIYFYKLTADDFSEVKRMVLLK